ncbi:hypothetical protein SAMN05444354_113195 [Stigmatella aurantiaca]|uniref:Uncharacterized protein n=1 Tax=Stigmatella aurantiaca TaxID=41 RepID=A0A1H7WVP3_STIAU|nr:hypothetical protein [Stigmatella aurantiaca]SEM24987.1 hypothetical protein SAMN05444354_113195 [Stigmatella aurantiaca]
MGRPRKEWWQTVATERDYLTVSLLEAEASFEVAALSFQDLERRFLREAMTPNERLHLKRLTAIDVLDTAFLQRRPWSDFGPWLRRLKRLGFPDLWSRFHIATLYVQSLSTFPEQARDAFSMLADVERRVLRRRKDRSSRQQMLDGIEHARREATRHGILPPNTLGQKAI